ncbi:MAG: DUF6526 family protein [Acidobacteriales bacterium]|nr:DUF6526 family protein [Terriglobales bacterium]
MKPQNFDNHTRFVVGYHGVLFVLLLAILGGSVVNLIKSWGDHTRIYSASLILALTIAVFMVGLFARIFALKAQDRAIRAEENLRHFVLTGKLLDPRLSIRQIIGLRFAPDEEFVELAKRAVAENLSEIDIKKAVKNWKADTYRV